MKKICTIIATSLLMTVIFTGCSFGENKVTAETLLENPFKTDRIDSIDTDVRIDMAFDMDMGELLNEENANQTSKMNAEISADCKIQVTKDVDYMTGKVCIDVFGVTQEQNIKTYTDLKNGVIYEYNSDAKTWTKSDVTENTFDVSILTDLSEKFAEMVESPELKKPEKEDATYIVTGNINMSGLTDLLKNNMTDVSDEIDLSDAKTDIILEFDKESNRLNKITFTLDTDSIDVETLGISLTTFKVEVAINEINDIDVTIPENVIGNAIDNVLGFENDFLEQEFEDATTDNFVEEYPSFNENDPIEEKEQAEEKIVISDELYEDIKLCTYIFNVDSMDMDTVDALLGQFYKTLPEYEIRINLVSFLDSYTVSEFKYFMSYFESLGTEPKIATAFLYDMGIINDDFLVLHGIDINEISELVSSYVEPCK